MATKLFLLVSSSGISLPVSSFQVLKIFCFSYLYQPNKWTLPLQAQILLLTELFFHTEMFCLLSYFMLLLLVCSFFCLLSIVIWKGEFLFFFQASLGMVWGFPGGSAGRESTCIAGDTGDSGSIPGSRRSPGGGNSNPLWLPRKFHGQRSLEGYNPKGHRELGTTEH